MHYTFERRADGTVEIVKWSERLSPDAWQLFRPNPFTGDNARHALAQIIEGVPVNERPGVWHNWQRISEIERGSEAI
jgi:hypothetical protein